MRGKATVSLCLILYLLFCTLAGRSFSQTGGVKSPQEMQRWLHEQRLKDIERQAEFQRKTEEQRFQSEQRQKAAHRIREEYADEAWQEALGATPEQWKAIKPKLDRIQQLRSVPGIELSVYAFSGRGSTNSNSFSQGFGGSGGAGTGTGSGYASGSAHGSGGVSRGGHYAFGGGAGGTAGAQAAVGGSGVAGGSSVKSEAASEGSGYSFAIGGTGPVKKKVGDVSLGWLWRRPSLNTEADKLTKGDKACEQLLDTLEIRNPDAEQVHQRLEALRQIRAQRQAELRETQRQLRELVTPEQEAKLVLMGYLD